MHRLLYLLLPLALAAAEDVRLAGPLATLVPIDLPPAGPGGWELTGAVAVADGAPAGLGAGLALLDRHGRWFGLPLAGPLAPGVHQLRVAVGPGSPLLAEGHRGAWGSEQLPLMVRAGLQLWAEGPGRVRVSGLRLAPLAQAGSPPLRLLDLDAPAAARTGERWELSCRPQPYPADPFDPEVFALELVVRQPDGVEHRLPGFHHQPCVNRDGGDREIVDPAGAAGFRVRWRPRLPGTHRLRLEARWAGGRALSTAPPADGGSAGTGGAGSRVSPGGSTPPERSPGAPPSSLRLLIDLPPVEVAGSPYDGWLRVDAKDHRFFSAGGAFAWPVGLNLRSVWDLRGVERTGSRLTPARGSLAYDAYLDRLAAGGGDACEVWLSSWNYALEWRADWPPFQGAGRYSAENAWRLDRLFERAEERGVRINLVVENHGRGSENTDHEWEHHPFNRANGGWLASATQLFTDRRAAAMQARFRRHLVAMLADSPALLGWKLWSEVNLTAGRQPMIGRWIAAAADHLHAIDAYRHPVALHWSGNYRSPDRDLAALPQLDYLCIDAYHGRDPHRPDEGWLLAALLNASTADPGRGERDGLGWLGKPILVTEFGGDWCACPQPELLAEHASGPWAALVAGHAGGPMLWWFEWLDQGDRYGVYAAIRRYLAGEDLRGAEARCVALAPTSSAGGLWSRAWSRPGRMLGYLLDRGWGWDGREAPAHPAAEVRVGSDIRPGPIQVEWWDCDTGRLLRRDSLTHAGGELRLTAPAFRRHIAFKMWRG